MRIVTPRFVIRKFRESDAEALYWILSDPEVMCRIEPPYSFEQTRAFLEKAGLGEKPLVWALEETSGGQLIGQIIFHPYDESRYEIGWILARAYWGRGIAEEATDELVRYAVRQGVSALVIECADEQAVTKHIAEKKGFFLTEQGEICVFQKALHG